MVASTKLINAGPG